MIDLIFTKLAHAVEQSSILALAAAFVWGMLSVLLSPCHLVSIPLVVGYMGARGRLTVGRAFAISSVFSVGIMATIAVVGLITGLAGRLVGDLGVWTGYSVAAIFLIFGLVLMDVIKLPWSVPAGTKPGTRGLAGAVILGFVFGLSVGPCTFAFMAPILGVSALSTAYGASTVLAYGLGHCSIIVLAGTFAGAVQRYMNWNEKSRAIAAVRKLCGLIIIVAAIYMLVRT